MTTPPPGLGQLVRALLDRIDPAVERTYRRSGLEWRPRFTPVLRVLAEHGPMRIKDIADALSLSHSALSQTVSAMVERGWVTTAPGRDARERILHLTPKAQAALPRLRVHWQRAAEAARGLSEDIGISLEATLAKALEALQRESFDDRLARAATTATTTGDTNGP